MTGAGANDPGPPSAGVPDAGVPDAGGPSDAGAIAGAPDAPVDGGSPSCPPPPSCKIEVRANQLSPLGYYHMFIVFTDANGKEFYLRGGPSGSGPASSSGLSSGLSGGSSQGSSGSNSSASSDASSGGAPGGSWGYIATQYGEYKPGTIDWDPGAKAITLENSPSTCPKYEALKQTFDAITASKTSYNPLGPNSNSCVFTALRKVGITPAEPGGVWAPGADVPIDIK